MTRFACCKDFPERSIPFSRLKPMDKSVSAAETSTTSRKRRGKYCAAFGCNNSAYDANGIRTSYHFFQFPKDAHRRNRWCTLIKRRHGRDGFVVSTSTVLCHEHFRAEDITKRLSGRWHLRKGLCYFSVFVMPLLCLHHNSAVCVSAFGYLKLQKPEIFRYLLTRVRILYQITDFANECLLSFLAEVFYLHVLLNFL